MSERRISWPSIFILMYVGAVILLAIVTLGTGNIL